MQLPEYLKWNIRTIVCYSQANSLAADLAVKSKYRPVYDDYNCQSYGPYRRFHGCSFDFGEYEILFGI